MKNCEFVTNWVLETVKKEYADDIALVVAHTTLRIDDSEETTISYFVPITERGYQFGRTFILDGEGFDIWGIDWNRLERFADLEEYNITCLADGNLLYARTEEDARRFEALKKRQADNLSNPVIMRKNALSAYAQAKSIYSEMLFATDSDVKMGAGYLIDYLAQAVAFSNLRYFKKSQTDQISELSSMENVPESFFELYQSILLESDTEIQKKLCYQAISIIKQYLEAQPAENSEEETSEDFQMLADWYAELSYTWLRIRHYARENDTTRTYMWGAMLQEELNRVCQDFGFSRMELMERYDPKHLLEFAAYADTLEASMREAITAGGGIIHEYRNIEEFLHEV